MRNDRFYQHVYDLPFQRDIWQHLLRTSSNCYPVARRDPIFTPLFTAILGAGGFGLTGTALSVGVGLSTAIATTALTIGISALLAPKPPKPEDGHLPVSQSLPFRMWAVGRTRLAGAKMLWEAKGSSLFMVCALVAHPSHAINRYYLNSDEVFLTDIPSGKVINKGDRYLYGSVNIYTRLGAMPETPYAAVVAKLASSGAWTNAHRGDGQTSLAMIAKNGQATKQQVSFPYGAPSPSVEGDWAVCWDFRDPAQSAVNPATWVWTRNSALILAWHLCFNEFGFRLNYAKAIMPVIDMWQEEANICDEQIPIANGGFWTRYQCSGWDTTENGPKAGLNAILASCDGHLVSRGDGARILTVGKFRESRCGTINERHITGHKVQYDVLFEEEINRLIPKFTYPDTGYTSADTDYFEDVPAQLDAGRVLSQDGTYQWVTNWRQARFLGSRDFKRARQKVKGSLDLRLAGINSVYKRWNRLISPVRLPKLDGRVVENRQSILSIMNAGFSMDFIQHPDDIDAWNPAVDEGKQPPIPPVVDSDTIAIPVINTVQAQSTGTSVSLRVLLIDPVDTSLTPVVLYRLADAGGGVPGGWVRQQFDNAVASGGYIEVNTGVVPSGVLLDVQALYRASNDKDGDPSATTSLTTVIDPSAPGAPVNLLAPNSVTTVPVSARAANDNTKSLVFKRGTTSQSFAAATLLGRFSATANQVISLNDVPGAGTYKYWCGAENGSGIVSATQASVTTVVT